MGTWVFKADGAIQCTGVPATPLDEARAELARIVGADAIERACTFARPTIAMCGAPGGGFNACRLTDAGFALLMDGIVGRDGWAAWPFAEPPCEGAGDVVRFAGLAGPEVPFPMSIGARTLLPAASAGGDPGPMPQGDASPAQIAAAVQRLTDAATLPVAIRELLGWELRVIRPGDMITLDFRTHRVNVSVDADDRITAIGFS